MWMSAKFGASWSQSIAVLVEDRRNPERRVALRERSEHSRPVQALLRLVHVEQIDIGKIKKEDLEVTEYLRASNPELFKTLKKEARASKKKERGTK